MTTVSRRRRGGKKRKKALFYDSAIDGYIREITLDRFNEIVDVAEVNEIPLIEAAESAGHFPERVPYHAIWRRWWEEQVMGQADLNTGNLMVIVEQAVRGALREEEEERKRRGDHELRDTLHFKAFSDRSMEHLLSEADGEMEDPQFMESEGELD